ncbi:MAG: urease accessory protein [Bacteroidota bacterium]
METSLPLLFAAVVGFGHAFEADHLVAVGNIVTKREKMTLAIKDGIYWGLGHTSTIFLIGLVIIIGRATFLNGYFGYFEATVGLMLILLGFFRLYKYFKTANNTTDLMDAESNHHLAYGVGLIHGLAGSGAMVLLVMTEIQSSFSSMVYLFIFGIGSVLGMLVAAGIFSLPFSKKLTDNQNLQLGLIILSSVLCIGYGGYVMMENII